MPRYRGLSVLVLVAASVWLCPTGAILAQCPGEKIVALDAAAGDFFGESCAISGDFALVGARCKSDFGTCSGAAYVFRFDTTAWIQDRKLTASDAGPVDLFGESVDLDGDFAVMGARLDDDSGSASGSAYVFHFDGSAWVQQGRAGLPAPKLTASDAQPGDQFGYPVAISGDTVVVAARLEDEGATDAGAVYVFRFDGTDWTEEAKLIAPDATPGAFFGDSLGLDGDTLLVGAQADSDPANLSGAVYVFTRSGVTWTHQDTLTAGGADAADHFGSAVALAGPTAAVGAYGDDDAGDGAGAVYVFEFSGGVWTQQDKLSPCDAADGDGFGRALAIDGDQIAVGARDHDVAGDGAGAGYVFEWDGSSWFQTVKLTACDAAPGDQFGWSAAIAARVVNATNVDTVLFGARNDDDAGSNAGSAYLFDLNGLASTDCNANGLPDSCEIATGALTDCNANGVPDVCEIDVNSTAPGGPFFCTSGCDPDCNNNGVPDECDQVLAPIVTTDPISRTVCEGDSAVFTVVADGDVLVYQWLVDGTPLGSDDPVLIITNVQLSGSGAQVECVVSNPCGSVTSDAATLTVWPQPGCIAPEACCFAGAGCLYLTPADCTLAAGASQGPGTTCEASVLFTQQPQDQTKCDGESATFSVTAIGVAMAFQWRKDEAPIAGATATTYTINAVTAADAGAYDLVVTNDCGSVQSRTATLTIGGLTQCPTEACCFSDGSCTDLTPARCILDSGTPQGPGTDCASATCAASVGACCFAGGGCIELTEAECAIPGGLWHAPPATCQTAVCTGAPVACCLSAGCVELSAADCLTAGGAPQGPGTTCASPLRLVQQPDTTGACLGGPHTLSVQVDGTGPYQYQWRRDGADIAGATGPGLVIDPVTPADEGAYDVVIVVGSCTGTSDSAILDCSFGACCMPDGSCSDDMLEPDCVTAGGTYEGDDSTCAQTSCPLPDGACCLADFNCVQLTEADCGLFAGSTWAGPLTPCTSCPEATGACCVAPGDCFILTQTVCNLIPDSRWAGPLTTCEDTNLNGVADVCDAGAADIDFDGDVDMDDVIALVQVLLGTPLDPMHVARADLNGDGRNAGDDIAPFLDAMLMP